MSERGRGGGGGGGRGGGGGVGADLEALSASGSFWQLGEELHHQVLAATVQEPVCLIQDKELDCVCGQFAGLYEVHDAPCTCVPGPPACM